MSSTHHLPLRVGDEKYSAARIAGLVSKAAADALSESFPVLTSPNRAVEKSKNLMPKNTTDGKIFGTDSLQLVSRHIIPFVVIRSRAMFCVPNARTLS